MPQLSKRVKQVASFLIASGVIFFFARAVQRNWSEVKAHHFRLDYPLLVFSFATVIAASLLASRAWQTAINVLSESRQLTFPETVATVNTTSLTKYLPGKFWSYAIQMYWLSARGFSKSLILYVNLINLVISLVTGVLLSLVFLLFARGPFPRSAVLVAFVLLLSLDAICMYFHTRALKLGIALVKRLFKREMAFFDVSAPLLIRLHLIHFLAQVVSGIGGFALCAAIGYDLGLNTILLVMASLILSDTAGFVVFLVPGGLGVREATMYMLLGGAAIGSLAVVFPLVSRMLYMGADLALGVVALQLLRRFIRREPRTDPSQRVKPL
ncbi:MAG: lysylphosphatidylglycerol synthase domain-containing protein [Pseudomonadota bacterium]